MGRQRAPPRDRADPARAGAGARRGARPAHRARRPRPPGRRRQPAPDPRPRGPRGRGRARVPASRPRAVAVPARRQRQPAGRRRGAPAGAAAGDGGPGHRQQHRHRDRRGARPPARPPRPHDPALAGRRRAALGQEPADAAGRAVGLGVALHGPAADPGVLAQQRSHRAAVRDPIPLRYSRGQLEATRANARIVAAELRFLDNTIAMEVRDGHQALVAAYRRARLANQEVELSRQLAAAEYRKFQLGAGDLLLVNLREVASADAATNEIDAVSDYFVAKARLEVALGEGVQPVTP
ncbi:TolC family protein [Nannocystis pusilla]|uniref:TolC family protein n=1 Tax=Nannocystis pusilla TaxID=889268 RepID=UPI003B81E95E